MATITVEAKRVKTGQSLTDFYTQAASAINQLKGIKINLANLKTTVKNDPDFTVEDEAEVQAKIDDLLAQIAGI